MKELDRCKDCPHYVSRCKYIGTMYGEVESPFGWTNSTERSVTRYGHGCDYNDEEHGVAFAIIETGCPLSKEEMIDYFGEDYYNENIKDK